jgi:uncharacterized MAPEG superfamily protein
MWIDVVCVLSIVQFIGFGVLVGSARGKYGVHAPATSGHPMFDRIYRVQMNTLELLVAFVPALYLASRYWSADIVAAVGAVYLVGRIVYWRAYTQDPARRALGFALSVFPILGMLGATLVGAFLAAVR